MLEVLVALANDDSEQVVEAAGASLDALDPSQYLTLAANEDAAPELLAFLCLWGKASAELVEAAVFNKSIPDTALARLAALSSNPSIIEAISIKQQSLIRSPEIIEAILANPARSPEAERRAREVKAEFFDKQFGAKLVAEEQRVRQEAQSAQATITVGGVEDLFALGLLEEGVDDSLIDDYMTEVGPLDETTPAVEQQARIAESISQTVSELLEEEGTPQNTTGRDAARLISDRMPIFQQIALMSIKDRVMLGIKGTREARLILIRDSNRIVCSAVLRNPRLTDSEVENISSIRTLPEEILRQIGQNRAWAKSYIVVHNLVRNPKTPVSLSLGFLNRILTRDLRALSTNKNVPDVIRTSAARLYVKRSMGAS